jgi:hypothetical protein
MKNSSEKIKKLIKKLYDQGYLVLELPFEDKLSYANEMQSFFNNAFQQKNLENKFQALVNRPELGSVPINASATIENVLKKTIKNSKIYELAKKLWDCDEILYSRNFSHFRYVDPAVLVQMQYQPIHIDYSFLNTKSLNICIPATSYGGDYPGIEIFKEIKQKPFSYGEKKFENKEPEVVLGKALIFHEHTPHRRSVNRKKLIRINTEFRIFPASTSDREAKLGLINF